MLKILITGSNGQLGSELRKISGEFPAFRFIFTDVDELDITNADILAEFIEHNAIDVVINCAAYTAVDKAESDPGAAMLINYHAVENLIAACKEHETFLVHISTDYVFDGNGTKPYKEQDATSPASVYGKSKLAGENAILSCLSKGMIIRTSWLYSTFGNNFVKTILKKGEEKGTLNVVSDQVGCPTYARDLARMILDILPGALSINKPEIFHFSDEGYCSWYELAKEAIFLSGIDCTVNPVSSEQYPQIAPRPRYSILDKTKIKTRFQLEIPHWKESLANCIKTLKVEN